MDLFSRLLDYYGLTKEELIKRSSFQSLDEIGNPFDDFKGFKEAIDLIEGHISKKDKIVIYGDYDVDGITSTSILVSAFLKRGIKVGYFIPSRYKEGYGLNSERVEEFALKGYKLVITIDNGITAFDQVELARNKGMDVLVIDHHQPSDKLPRFSEVIHPELGKYCSYNISAAFLALLVSYALNGRKYDEYLACLAGIAVFSDVMPLTGKNLILAKHALRELNLHHHPALDYLLGMKKEDLVTSRDVSFKLISPLNSVGRMDTGLTVNKLIEFLVSDDSDLVHKDYLMLLEISTKKKSILRDYRNLLPNKEDGDISILFMKGVPTGLVGALCSFLTNKTNKPCLIFTSSPTLKDCFVGSGRAPEGIDLYSVIEKHKDDYVAFGGHAYALGITIKKEKFPEFEKYIRDDMKSLEKKVKEEKAVLIKDEDISFDSLKTLSMFEPFGEGFNYPNMAYIGSREGFIVSKDLKHLFKTVSDTSSITYFSYDKSFDMNPTSEVALFGHLDTDIFNSKKRVRFQISSFIPVNEAKIIK